MEEEKEGDEEEEWSRTGAGWMRRERVGRAVAVAAPAEQLSSS